MSGRRAAANRERDDYLLALVLDQGASSAEAARAVGLSPQRVRQIVEEGQAAQLAATTGSAPWVKAVVVVWSEFEQGVVGGDRVTFVSGARFADWLGAQPIRLSEDGTRALAAALRRIARR
jgi:hypothetical protein